MRGCVWDGQECFVLLSFYFHNCTSIYIIHGIDKNVKCFSVVDLLVGIYKSDGGAKKVGVFAKNTPFCAHFMLDINIILMYNI